MNIEVFELIEPTEENGYCAFDSELEDDENIFFHMTPSSNEKAIINKGFKSAKELGTGVLESVSYAKRSSSCFSNLGCQLEDEHVIFAVRFQPESLPESLELKEAIVNASDIRVYKKCLQPKILGVTYLPNGFRIS